MNQESPSLDNSQMTLTLVRSLIEQYTQISKNHVDEDSYTQAYRTMVERLILCLLGGLVEHFDRLIETLENGDKADEHVQQLHGTFRNQSRRILGEGSAWKDTVTVADLVNRNGEMDGIDSAALKEVFTTASILEAKVRVLLTN